MAKIPGQTSTISLLISSFWTISALFILIVGHLVWVFIGYGIMTNSNALLDLEAFLPMLSEAQLFTLAGLAIVADIWILISQHKQKNQHKHKSQHKGNP